MLKLLNPLWIIQIATFYVDDLFGGGAEAPDYTPMAQASEEAARIAADLGNRQLKENKRQYDQNYATMKPIVAAQLGIMNQTMQQGEDYYDYQRQMGRPVENQLNYEAMGFTPDEVQQIEALRAREEAAWREKNPRQQPNMPVTYDVPTFNNEVVLPKGALKGSDIKAKTISLDTGNKSTAFGTPITINSQVKADPNKYYIKQANGTYKEITPSSKVVEGKRTVTEERPDNGSSDYSIMETPETDALIQKLSMQASQRMKAAEQGERDKIQGLSDTLATRIGESNADVYTRNRGDIDAEVDTAVADSRNGMTSTMNTAARQGLRYGMNPASIALTNGTLAVAGAGNQAAAANNTRKVATDTMYQRGVGEAGQVLTGATNSRNMKIQDDTLGTARKLDVAGMYRGMPGASQGAYSTSVNAGNSAGSNAMAPGSQYLNGMNAGNATIMAGQNMKMNGLSNILNSQTGVYNANAGQTDALFGALGQVGGAAAASYFAKPAITSDKNKKKNIKGYSAEAALKGVQNINVKKWEYDPSKVQDADFEMVDKKEHIGAMAQDVQKHLGNQVSDGKRIDIISALGVNMAAIKALADKVDNLEGAKA